MKRCMSYFLIPLFAIGCSNGSDSGLTTDTEREFEDGWVLTDYVLDDGTMKSVPENVGGVGIAVAWANFGRTQNIPTVIWQGLQTASTGPSELTLSAGDKIKSHFWPSMHLTLMRSRYIAHSSIA